MKNIPRRHPRGRERTFDTKRPQEVMKDRMRDNSGRTKKKQKKKNSTKRRAIGRDRRVGKMKGAMKIQ